MSKIIQNIMGWDGREDKGKNMKKWRWNMNKYKNKSVDIELSVHDTFLE